MKLIDITCPKCNSVMSINSELREVSCNYCGNKMLLDDEVNAHRIVGGFEFGYEQEMGRLKAQKDFAEEQALEQERREARRAQYQTTGELKEPTSKGTQKNVIREDDRLVSKIAVAKKRLSIVNIVNAVMSVLVFALVLDSDGGASGNIYQTFIGGYGIVESLFVYMGIRKRDSVWNGIMGFIIVVRFLLSFGGTFEIAGLLIFVAIDILYLVFFVKYVRVK